MALTRPKIGQFTTEITSLTDPITVLNGGSSSANVDVGFLMNRANGLVSNVALYWNESGNTFVTAFTSNTGVTNSNIAVTRYANVTTGSLLPGANVTYDLGGPTQRWKDLWLSGTTIYLGGAVISTENTANVIITNPAGGSFSITGNTPGQASGTFGNLIANSGVASTSTNTGALQVIGGAGITGNLYVGGNISAINIFQDRGADVNNWDSLTVMGVYLINRTSWTGTTNTPINSQYFTGQLEVLNTGNISIAQYYRPYNSTSSGDVYWTRSKYSSGSWSNWVEVINGSEVMDGGSF
jgi:hypothetical protein